MGSFEEVRVAARGPAEGRRFPRRRSAWSGHRSKPVGNADTDLRGWKQRKVHYVSWPLSQQGSSFDFPLSA